VLISWFVDKDGILPEPDTIPTHDCHDEIRLASLLAGHMSAAYAYRRGGILNLEHIRLAVFQPIIFDNGDYDRNIIKNGNIVFYSTADGQSIFHYNCDTDYGSIENCVFNYRGSVETKNIVSGSSRIFHERINAIRFERCNFTYFCYWKNILATGLTGYIFVNQTYLQEDSFENISSTGCNGMISYNTDGYYEGNKGSSNIVKFTNCNLNGGSTSAPYYSKCTIEYLWDFRGFMELTIENAVSQGVGKEGQKAIRLGPGVVMPQCVKLDGFWIEYGRDTVDGRVFIESSTDLYLDKTNVSGFVTNGGESINIYYNAVASNYFNETDNFIDNSSIAATTAQVSIYYTPTTYKGNIQLSDKFLDWFDKGIIRILDTKKYSYGGGKQSVVTINSSVPHDILRRIMRGGLPLRDSADTLVGYISEYKSIPIFVIEKEGDVSGSFGTMEHPDTCGSFGEVVFRVTPLVNVTEENKNDVYVEQVRGGGYMKIYKASVGDIAGEPTEWMRVAGIASGFGGIRVKNIKIL
jgi:hypothetical protein